jgi:hypothetical protein
MNRMSASIYHILICSEFLCNTGYWAHYTETEQRYELSWCGSVSSPILTLSVCILDLLADLDKMQWIKGLTLAPRPPLVYCTLQTDLI